MEKKEFNDSLKLLFEKGYDLDFKNIKKMQSSGYCGHTVLINLLNNFLKEKGLDGDFAFEKIAKLLNDKEKFPLVDEIKKRLIDNKIFPSDEKPSDEDFALFLLFIIFRESQDDLIIGMIKKDGWLTDKFISLILTSLGFAGLDADKTTPKNADSVKELLEGKKEIKDYAVLINKQNSHWIILKKVIDENNYECYDPYFNKKTISSYETNDQLYFFVFDNDKFENLKNTSLLVYFDESSDYMIINDIYDNFLKTELLKTKKVEDFKKIYSSKNIFENIYLKNELISSTLKNLKNLPGIILYDNQKKIALSMNIDANLNVRDDKFIDFFFIFPNGLKLEEIKEKISQNINEKLLNIAFLYEEEYKEKSINGIFEKLLFFKNRKFMGKQNIYSIVTADINLKDKSIKTPTKFIDLTIDHYINDLISFATNISNMLSATAEADTAALQSFNFENDSKILSKELKYFDPLEQYFFQLKSILSIINGFIAKKIELNDYNKKRLLNAYITYKKIKENVKKNKEEFKGTGIIELLESFKILFYENFIEDYKKIINCFYRNSEDFIDLIDLLINFDKKVFKTDFIESFDSFDPKIFGEKMIQIINYIKNNEEENINKIIKNYYENIEYWKTKEAYITAVANVGNMVEGIEYPEANKFTGLIKNLLLKAYELLNNNKENNKELLILAQDEYDEIKKLVANTDLKFIYEKIIEMKDKEISIINIKNRVESFSGNFKELLKMAYSIEKDKKVNLSNKDLKFLEAYGQDDFEKDLNVLANFFLINAKNLKIKLEINEPKYYESYVDFHRLIYNEFFNPPKYATISLDEKTNVFKMLRDIFYLLKNANNVLKSNKISNIIKEIESNKDYQDFMKNYSENRLEKFLDEKSEGAVKSAVQKLIDSVKNFFGK